MNNINKSQNKIKYRIGRIYLVKPSKTPGQKTSKERPCILLKMKHKKFLFIQLGTTKINHKLIANWTIRLNYIWAEIGKTSFLHIDISKYETRWAIKGPFSNNRHNYIDLKKEDVINLYSFYMQRIKELEKIRIVKAKKLAFAGDIKGSARQLSLLKIIFPIKHKRIMPYNLAKKWKKSFDDSIHKNKSQHLI